MRNGNNLTFPLSNEREFGYVSDNARHEWAVYQYSLNGYFWVDSYHSEHLARRETVRLSMLSNAAFYAALANV